MLAAMYRLGALLMASLAWGCGKSSDSSAPAPTPPTPPGPVSPGGPALVPVAVKPVVDQWWLAPSAHCPDGTKLMGGPPPGGTGVWCADEKYVRNGPRTNFHPNGTKASEGWEVDSQWVGPWSHWHDNGTLAREEIRLPHDGLTGRYRQWDRRGKLLGELDLPGGTGRATRWNEGGTVAEEGAMKDGRREGTWRSFDDGGSLASEHTYRHGVPDGPAAMYDGKGRKRAAGAHRAGEMDGRWSYFLDSGEIDRVDVYRAGELIRTHYYQGGTMLGTEPAPTACDTEAGVAAAMGAKGSDREQCVERARAFPGVVLIGSFAHDRGCMPVTALIDCVRRDGPLAAPEILARVGWTQADPAHRGAIALRYLQQVATVFGNRLASNPDEPVVTPQPDGSVTIVAWADHPSGMRPGRRASKMEYRFTAAGELSSKVIGSIDEQR